MQYVMDAPSRDIGHATDTTSTSDTAIAIPAKASAVKVWVDVDSYVTINGAATALTPGTGNMGIVKADTQQVYTVHTAFRRDADGAPQSAHLHVATVAGTGEVEATFYL